jgi:hypothetical protein
LAELDKARTCVDRTAEDCVTKAERLSRQVVHVFSFLVDLGLLPIKDIPKLPKIAQEVLSVADLILKRLKEALASGVVCGTELCGGCHARDFGSYTPSPFHFPFFCPLGWL